MSAPGPRPRRAPPPARVRAMFDGIVDRYDLVNRLLSGGLDRRWRRAAAGATAGAAGGRTLDLGCGTGDLTLLLAARGPATGIDLSAPMLSRAQAKASGRASFVQASAYALPFPDGAFAAVVSAFVLRNLDDLAAAFAEAARVSAPGARLAFVDITEPRHPLVRRLFDGYFGTAAPALGALVGRREAYRYLAASLGQLPPPEEVCRLLAAAGFEACHARPLTLGAVTLFTARRGGGARPASEGAEARRADRV